MSHGRNAETGHSLRDCPIRSSVQPLFSSTQLATFSLREKLLEGKGAVSLRVVGPFDTMRFKIKTGDDQLIQFTEIQFGVRAVFLTFQYNFGQTPRFRVPKQDDTPQANTGFPPP